MEGICLYPIAHHPGWEENRDCLNGLLGVVPGPEVRERLAQEIRAFQEDLAGANRAHRCA